MRCWLFDWMRLECSDYPENVQLTYVIGRIPGVTISKTTDKDLISINTVWYDTKSMEWEIEVGSARERECFWILTVFFCPLFQSSGSNLAGATLHSCSISIGRRHRRRLSLVIIATRSTTIITLLSGCKSKTTTGCAVVTESASEAVTSIWCLLCW